MVENSGRTPVILESPYKGDVERNEAYALRCVADSLSRNEAPHAGRLVYTRVLDDNVPEQRAAGIDAHCAFIACVPRMVLYIDYGITDGMQLALYRAHDEQKAIEFRKIGTGVPEKPVRFEVPNHIPFFDDDDVDDEPPNAEEQIKELTKAKERLSDVLEASRHELGSDRRAAYKQRDEQASLVEQLKTTIEMMSAGGAS